MKAFENMSRKSLSIIALVMAAVTLLAVNMIGWESLKLYRLDVTENKLFTLSDSTRKVIASVDDPITIKLYYTEAIGARAPTYGLYADRIKALLNHYSSLSGGKIIFQKISPEPFSDEEDRAVAAGLTAIPLGDGQGNGYLALVGSNTTDDEELIPFLSLERSAFLEYDITRMIHKLAKPAKKSVGLLTGLSLRGAMGPDGRPRPPWIISQQLDEFFDVKMISGLDDAVPTNVDMLLVIAPAALSEKLARSIDQFALSGKPVLVFADPFTETNRRNPTPLKKGNANFLKLLSGWGADIAPDKVLSDPRNSRRIQYNAGGQPIIINYIVWLSYGRDALDRNNPIYQNVQRLNVATPGALSKTAKATTKFEPLLSTGPDTKMYSTDDMVPPNPVKLINTFLNEKKVRHLMARVSGETKATFAAAPPDKDKKKDDKAPAAKHLAKGNINVIVVADSDMLFDSFWAQARQIGNQRVVIPIANNRDLLLNAMENLSGGAALSGLRGRGIESRPFTLIQAIRRDAETKFRKREQILNKNLKAAQKKLVEIQSKARNGKVILTDEDKQTIAKIRQEVVSTRRDLREVQRALNRDIDNLEFWVQVANTGGVPLFILLVAGLWQLIGRKRGTAKGA